MGIFDRTKALFGEFDFNQLQFAHVAVFGLGGVGGHTAEALVRCGVGEITLVDNDVIQETNINRQIFATISTIGKKKTLVAENRLKDINPDVITHLYDVFVDGETIDEFDFQKFDFVIDAIDTVTAKLLIIKRCKSVGTKFIVCLGTGGKKDPLLLTVADIKDTSYCPLARVMRKELAKRNITDVPVVYSKEKSQPPSSGEIIKNNSRPAPSSCALVPPVAGIILAEQAVKLLTTKD